jgi:hypothetical protein
MPRLPPQEWVIVLELREQLAEQVATQLDFAVGQVEVVAQLAGKLVAAAGAEHQAVVGRALAVGDLAAAFAEGLPLAQADFIPGAAGSGSVATIRLCTGNW